MVLRFPPVSEGYGLSGVYSCFSAAHHWSAVETDWNAGDGVVDYNNFVAFFGITWSNTEVCVVEKEGERKRINYF